MSACRSKPLAFLTLTALLVASPAAADPAVRDGAVMGVRSGMTLEAARAAVPTLNWIYEVDFMVDFSALCAVKGGPETGETQFCALVPQRDAERGADMIEAIAVFGGDLKTPEGVHPGMSVAAAAEIYGQPSLSYSLENESREFLVFDGAPEWMSFRATSQSSDEGLAGVYPATGADESYHETSEYADDATLDALWID